MLIKYEKPNNMPSTFHWLSDFCHLIYERNSFERNSWKKIKPFLFFFVFCLFVVVVVAISWAAPMAYGGSQARGQIGAVATGLRQSHSNVGSEPRLQPTPELTATPDP